LKAKRDAVACQVLLVNQERAASAGPKVERVHRGKTARMAFKETLV